MRFSMRFLKRFEVFNKVWLRFFLDFSVKLTLCWFWSSVHQRSNGKGLYLQLTHFSCRTHTGMKYWDEMFSEVAISKCFFLVKSRLQWFGHVIYFPKQKVILADSQNGNWFHSKMVKSCNFEWKYFSFEKIALATVIFFSDKSEQVCWLLH